MILERMACNRAIFLSFGASVALFLAFRWVHAGVGDGPLLDTLLNGSTTRSRLAEMSAQEINRHLIGTLTIDMLYPAAYGTLLAGLLFRLGGTWQTPLAILPLVGALLDVMENVVQAIALAGGPDLLDAKIILTGPKFAFFVLSAGLIAILALFALVRHLAR
ncbi:MAG: hypothetical protein OXE84_09735 [Rhodobacteraceae bacterium]|nr:hypothetical protein [Paracoccaceae bacterium]MCY4195456.1 hypothetical protein [Paracoccaceae bacterium]